MILVENCLCLFVPVNRFPIQCDAWSVLRKRISEGSLLSVVQCVYSIPHDLWCLLPSTVTGAASSSSGIGREITDFLFCLFILVKTVCFVALVIIDVISWRCLMSINLVFVFQYVLSVLQFTYPTLFQG